jgi:hypothetical protein
MNGSRTPVYAQKGSIRVGMSNHELENLCRQIVGKQFIGVYPCDAHPNPHSVPKDFCIVFNLSHQYDTGTHFIAVLRLMNKIIYFDSFGKPCSNIHIQMFLNCLKPSAKIVHNRKQLQHEKSIYCGIFCLAFLCVCFSHRQPLRKFQSKFTTNPKMNDKKAEMLVLRYIRQS